jgi:hypothetical protein
MYSFDGAKSTQPNAAHCKSYTAADGAESDVAGFVRCCQRALVAIL